MFVYLDDITNGLENVKISFLNEINSLRLPTFVSYTPHCVLKSDSAVEDFESISLPCNCRNQCNIDCPCSYSNSFSDGKLSEYYDHSKSKPIIECSELCSCSQSCSNRVVQDGIKFSLQVFLTEMRGFGVQAKEFIPKNSFVCEYAGEIIDSDEAQQRLSKQAPDDTNYIYVLNEHSSENKYFQTIIDPTCIGNVGRYLNHSCSPNLISVPVRASSMVPRICFFAKDDILPLQELTYNYGGDFVDNKNGSKWPQEDLTNCHARKCLCQSSNCSGFLPFVDDNRLNLSRNK